MQKWGHAEEFQANVGDVLSGRNAKRRLPIYINGITREDLELTQARCRKELR
jgi:hypothetical protein